MAGQGSQGGGGGHSSERLKTFATRFTLNQRAMTYYAAILGGVIILFILFHFIRVMAAGTRLSSGASPLTAPFVKSSRVLRRYLVRKVPLFPSAGHAWLAFVYVVLNLTLTFTPLQFHPRATFETNIAARTGWLSIVNICIAVFLGLKNTPLGFLTTWSYERLNILHQIVGYTALAQAIIHSAAYASYFIGSGNIARLKVPEEIYGTVSGFTLLTMVVVGFTVRRKQYEMFYIIHVSFFIITMVFLGLHQPESTKRMIYAVIVASSIWVLDRIVRLVRLTLYSLNNSATVHPLPHGGTKIVLQKPPACAKSGEHCFIWLPKIRTMEMHPFTIAAADPLEFVVASYDGFTRDLHEYAVKNPGATLKASVEGSYGTFPDPNAYDKVVLIAGGSGASFTVGMALNMLKRIQPGAQRSVTFVWMVKDYDHLEWFSGHLATVHHALKASVRLFVTRGTSPTLMSTSSTIGPEMQRSDTIMSATSSSGTFGASVCRSDDEKDLPEKPARIRTRTRQLSDPEKSGYESDPVSPGGVYSVSPTDTIVPSMPVTARTHLHGIEIAYSRPDIAAIIRDEIDATASDKRVLVMGCGPEGLMKQVRNTTASRIRTNGPAVELHCEQFGW